jgi:hypothetical protein
MKIGEVRVYDVAGTAVELTRVDPTTREYSFHTFKDQKSRYEVRVDGVLRAHIQCPAGFGNPWEIVSLGRDGMHVYDFERDDPQRVYPEKNYRMRGAPVEGRDELVLLIPGFIANGKLPTQEKIIADTKAAAERAKQREEESRISTERSKIEYAERQRLQEEHRQFTLEGLESIRDRFQGQLSNTETEALLTAIEKWKPK